MTLLVYLLSLIENASKKYLKPVTGQLFLENSQTNMTEEIKNLAITKTLQFINNTNLEVNKIEFKRHWYKLKERGNDFNEFLKDTTAIVNSYGGEDAFIIIGVDGTTKQLFDTDINDSGYDDSSKINDLIKGKTDAPIRFDIDYVNIDGKRLSVIHLFPSTEKPHLIIEYKKADKIYKNAIFIRSGSGTDHASKADIDRMYSERRNIIVQKSIEVSINLNDLKLKGAGNVDLGKIGKINLNHIFTIENTGFRPVAIALVTVTIKLPSQGNSVDDLKLSSSSYSHKNLVIMPGEIFNEEISLTSDLKKGLDKIAIESFEIKDSDIAEFSVFLSNQERIFPKLILTSIYGKPPVNSVNLRIL